MSSPLDPVATTSGSSLYYPHYWSTYCMHGLHDACRLTCKTCEAPCRCPCHDEVKNAEP